MDEGRERQDRGKVNHDYYYAVLGVSPSATDEEIKRAFRKLANELHPDRTNGDKALAERFLVVKDAYDTLQNPELRAVYDLGGSEAVLAHKMQENSVQVAKARREGFNNWANVWFDGKEGDSLRGRIIFGLRSGENLSEVKRRVDDQLDVHLDLIPLGEHDEWKRKQEDIMRQVEREYQQRGRSGYGRGDAGGEGSTERKRREFREWYNAWMNIGNPNGLYQEVMHRFQNRQSFREVQQWARDEIERKCREGEVPNVEFYSTGVNQLLEQVQREQLERERKKELKFRESFDAWINTQTNGGLFQEILEKLRRGENDQDIEQFACDKLKERIHKANIAPHISRDDYFIQLYEMLRSAFAFYAEENRRRKLDAWVNSVKTWAYGEMKNNVSYAAVLKEAERVARDGISLEEGLEHYLQAVRDALERARETLERERSKK